MILVLVEKLVQVLVLVLCEKNVQDVFVVNVSKFQVWKDVEVIVVLVFGWIEVIGVGDLMKLVYGENMILVISKIVYDDFKFGMSVVYFNCVGKLVVYQMLVWEVKGWWVQGINNICEDKDWVMWENFVGVVYVLLLYSDEKF